MGKQLDRLMHQFQYHMVREVIFYDCMGKSCQSVIFNRMNEYKARRVMLYINKMNNNEEKDTRSRRKTALAVRRRGKRNAPLKL